MEELPPFTIKHKLPDTVIIVQLPPSGKSCLPLKGTEELSAITIKHELCNAVIMTELPPAARDMRTGVTYRGKHTAALAAGPKHSQSSNDQH